MKYIRSYNSLSGYAFAFILSHSMLFGVSDCMAELDLSDKPLDIVTRPAPPNIMFVFDDSGSMDWDVLMEGQNEGRFNKRCFIYNTGDNAISGSNQPLVTDEDKNTGLVNSEKMWKSRCFKYNKVHYNPAVTYKPWPKPDGRPSESSDPWTLLPEAYTSGAFKVKSHPYKDDGANFNLTKLYTTFPGENVSIPVAHYFTEGNDGTVVLVALALDSIDYYTVETETKDVVEVTNQEKDDDGNLVYDDKGNPVCKNKKGKPIECETQTFKNVSHVKKITELDDATKLGVVTERTSLEEAKNFANWFSYYRRRSFTATAALAQAITTVNNSYIGMLSMHPGEEKEGGKVVRRGVRQPLAPVDVKYLNECEKPVTPVDDTKTLLENLYNLQIKGSNNTLLLTALQNVGEYYDQVDEDGDRGGLSDTLSPWFIKEVGGECQQSFAIAMTDGYYNDSVDKNDSKVTPVGNVDNEVDAGKVAPYRDGYSNTLADIAMYYYNKDLVADNPSENVSEDAGSDDTCESATEDAETDDTGDRISGTNRFLNSVQRMKTYGVAFGVDGNLGDPSQYTLKPGCKGDDCNYPEWPNPNNGNEEKVDDLFHASVNGRGEYLSANDPQELATALTNIFADITGQTGSAASVSVNGDGLYIEASSGNVLLYQTQYEYIEDSSDWLGKVYAYTVDEKGAVNSDDPVWEASEKLEDKLNGSSVRAVATYNPSYSSGDDDDGVAFFWGTLTKEQRDSLGIDRDEQTKIIAYIRGGKANEISNGGTYRNRESRLGDIVNSGAHYHEGYIYVGANDGMMHAFDAATGEERFAYIPSMVIPNLKNLADPDYGSKHKFFVDGTPMVTKMGGLSYLVGGLGKGGKGYYSINVTNANTIRNSGALAGAVLWEYPEKDTLDDSGSVTKEGTSQDEIDNLGYTFSRAHTVKTYASSRMLDGETEVTNPKAINGDDTNLDGYVTFFGNGYGSNTGRAVLYFLNPKTGELIKKIDVGGTDNGMGTPVAVDVNNDKKMDYIYGGDLNGNMWKFDIQDPNPANWQVAYSDEAGNPKPLITTAPDQAITSTPDITRHPDGGYLVVFGTGRFLGASDWENSTTQSFYGIWDYGDDDNDSAYLGQVKDRESSEGADLEGTGNDLGDALSLLEQTVVFYDTYPFPIKDDEGTVIGTKEEKVRVLSNKEPNWDLNKDTKYPKNHVGWFFDLPLPRERSTVNTIIRAGRAIMVSFMPSTDRCAGGAKSLIHELDVFTGGRLSKPAFDANGDGVIDENDMVSIGKDEDGKDIMVPPSAIEKDGRVQTPVIVGLDNSEKLQFSPEDGIVVDIDNGVYYWREF